VEWGRRKNNGGNEANWDIIYGHMEMSQQNPMYKNHRTRKMFKERVKEMSLKTIHVTQVVVCILRRCKALSSKPSSE
jgi:hypothetical protein